MRILLQKVSRASVSVEDEVLGSIGKGYVLLVGIMDGDIPKEVEDMVKKIAKLRLFEGPDGKINDLNILEVGGEVLVVSQFTLAGKTEKGNRPDYTAAAKPDNAIPLYERFVSGLLEAGIRNVQTGRFGAHMDVELVNDGPVTLMLESAS